MILQSSGKDSSGTFHLDEDLRYNLKRKKPIMTIIRRDRIGFIWKCPGYIINSAAIIDLMMAWLKLNLIFLNQISIMAGRDAVLEFQWKRTKFGNPWNEGSIDLFKGER